MVTQIHKQKIAVVALAVHPTGQPNRLADVRLAQLSTIMSPIGVHVPPWGVNYVHILGR